MRLKSEQEIMSATRPRDIFTMNLETIEQEKEEYINRFKPSPYNTVKNFVITQKVILLYRQALDILENGGSSFENFLTITDLEGKQYVFEIQYDYDIKLGKMYVSESNVIFVINQSSKNYYENYIAKTATFPKLDKEIWKGIRFMLPKVSKHFQSDNGSFVIILDLPCKIYPLREVHNYFGGKLQPEYVSSIMTRLYNFECYLDLIGINHNGITLDNLFFAPGRAVKEGETFTVNDMRIVGVFGGWFFSTYSNEKIKGMPREVYEVLPSDVKRTGYSSFEVDELSIKSVARELLGCDEDGEFNDVPIPLAEWVNYTEIAGNAYEEYTSWERIRAQSFGKHRFVEMDVSI